MLLHQEGQPRGPWVLSRAGQWLEVSLLPSQWKSHQSKAAPHPVAWGSRGDADTAPGQATGCSGPQAPHWERGRALPTLPLYSMCEEP